MNAAHTLIRFLRRQGRSLSPLLILTHDHPDPDAIASAWALSYLAQRLRGVESRIVYGGIIGRVENQSMVRLLRIPVHPLRVRSDFRKVRAVALVDTQPLFGNNPFPKDGQAALVVDHHPPVQGGSALISVIDPSAGATSVILAQALLEAGFPVPEDLATALVYGIVSETQDLGRETRQREIQTYRRILPFCDIRCLALIQNPQRPEEFFRTLKRSLDNAFTAGPLIGAHLGPVSSPDLVSQTSDFLLSYEGSRWSVCTGRYQNRLHFSVRALRPDRHAGRLLQHALQERESAGGHGSMAGGSLMLPMNAGQARWRREEERVVSGLLRRLRPGRVPEKRFPFRA